MEKVESTLQTDDLTLVPFLKINGVDVQPRVNGGGRVFFIYPESAQPLVADFYSGQPTVDLSAYVGELKKTRLLVYSMKRGER